MTRDFPESFVQTFPIRYEECGPGGDLRPSVHLRLMQELAFAHSAALGFPLAWYERHRVFWLVRRIRLIVHAPAGYGEALVYTTRVAGARRVMARRINTAARPDGQAVAAALVDWIFTQDGRAPARIHDELRAAFPALARAVAPLALPLLTPPVAPPPGSVVAGPVHIRESDLDPMGHVNHAAYLDMMDDALSRAGAGAAAYPRSYDLQYEAPATAGAALRHLAWRVEDTWAYRLERADGTVLLHGRRVPRALPLPDRGDSGAA